MFTIVEVPEWEARWWIINQHGDCVHSYESFSKAFYWVHRYTNWDNV